MPQRPRRLCVSNELGQSRTLPEGAGHFHVLAKGAQGGRGGRARHALLLGLGPDPARAAQALPDDRTVYYVEAPGFKSQMPEEWRAAIPPHFKEIAAADLDEFLMAQAEIQAWWPGTRLFPSFWGPIIGRCRWLKIAGLGPARVEDSVLMPATGQDLLAPEMCLAFAQAGLDVRLAEPKAMGSALPALLREHRPRLLFCINFQGLDPYGEAFHLLQAAGVPVVVWCVDNPFHLVSGLRSPYWRDCRLCVTDAAAMGDLRLHGARHVLHLPLAAWPEMFENPAPCLEQGLKDRLVFVGRSEFPGRAGFFAGCEVPPALAGRAADMLRAGERPDFGWWRRALDVWPLWPGKAVRQAGYGAFRSGLAWRASCLRQAAALPLTVYGDQGWQAHLPAEQFPGADLRGPVDYYGPLAGIYARAGAVLNATGMVMTAALTQRHFDVWAAGGFLLTDNVPGLAIFPAELVEPVRFARAEDIAPLARRWLADETGRQELSKAWQAHILAEHTYARRAQAVLDWLQA